MLPRPLQNNSMKDFVLPSIVGTSSIVAVLTLNNVMSFLVALVTIGAMLPVALERWKRYFKKKDVGSNSPFPDEN